MGLFLKYCFGVKSELFLKHWIEIGIFENNFTYYLHRVLINLIIDELLWIQYNACMSHGCLAIVPTYILVQYYSYMGKAHSTVDTCVLGWNRSFRTSTCFPNINIKVDLGKLELWEMKNTKHSWGTSLVNWTLLWNTSS